jgi:ABC-2 type transport system ATP-binding protein
MSIQVEAVTKRYGSQKALDGVSFTIKPGEVAGFIGPNGAGKSTMMKIITGFLPPDEGEVMVGGMNAKSESMNIRRKLGYLPESNPLYEEMYVREYLRYVGGIYKLGRSLQGHVDEIIRSTGLSSEKHKKIGALSKGYKQRVGLAQALIHKPDILILDEPTSGLDPNQIIEIRNLIHETGKEKTVLLSTHIMQEVEAICDRVIIINKGKIVADDRAEEIYRNSDVTRQTILIEFSSLAKEADIRSIEGVRKVASLDKNRWLIEGSATNDLREALFNFAVSNNLTVLSLQKQEKSLEALFQELTK